MYIGFTSIYRLFVWFEPVSDLIYARIKGHLEPTHLKSSPLFTFSTKSLGQNPGGVLNFELGTDVRPEVSTTTL